MSKCAQTTANSELTSEGIIVEMHSRVMDVALESAFKIPISPIFPTRRRLLTAQGLISRMNQKNGLSACLRCWEVGGQPEIQKEQEDLMRFDLDREYVDEKDFGQDNDSEWRSWHMDDPEPDSHDD